MFKEKVEVLEAYEDRTIRSVTLEVQMPSVVRFLRLRRGKGKGIKFSRENVYARDHGQCQYCGRKLTREEATYDHVVPRAQKGITCWENIVIACVPCNQRKGGRTPLQANLLLKSMPVKPKTLPRSARVALQWDKGMPISWRAWLRDVTYWHGALDEG
jgi:5-methylcytosine-specific restriction endonuclease McrA